MRTATININGEERLLCFSMRAIMAVNDRYGGVEQIGSALSGDDVTHNLQEAIWLISTMLEAGARYAALNGMDNVEFFVGRAEEVLPAHYEKTGVRADVVVVDPPRKGCDTRCLETIAAMAPDRVVYVSCDSATLARDLGYLCGRGYEVKKVRCCDMFGWTVHCETVVKLEREEKNG